MTDRAEITLMEQEYRIVRGLLDTLGPDDWSRPTDCPGWDVQDQVSHLAGLEGLFVGREEPEHEVADAPHIRNEVGRLNERHVDRRRPWSPEQVVADLDEAVAARLRQLRSLDDDAWSQPTFTATGMQPHAGALRMRIFDWYGHEQDIRRATDRPGHLDGPIAEVAADVFFGALGYVLVKRAGADDGTTLTLEVTGANGRTVPLAVIDGRGTVVDEAPDPPGATVTLDFEALLLRGYGRRPTAELEAAGRIHIRGDVGLGRRFVDGLDVTI